MAIGTDDIDFEEGQDDILQQEETTQETTDAQDGLIASMLQDRGIDKDSIKFEKDDGSLYEARWSDLSDEEKKNILDSSAYKDEDDLDDDEVDLINSIRRSGLTPREYLQRMEQDIQGRYSDIQRAPEYSVDQYNDDELFVADFMSRANDVTEEEAQEALSKAKSNPTLFAKQIGAIRNEYKTIEQENQQQARLEQQQQAKERFDQFARKIVDEISDFTEFQGYDLNMEDDDKQDLYDFITGTDAAGANHFAKALADPKILVQTAWFALNGKQMINDITNYFQKEITQVRQESYKKGFADAQMGKSRVVYKPAQSRRSSDIDEF